eukprot:scaffold66647_cov48-Tisochrysis_lutea.AAC.1
MRHHAPVSMCMCSLALAALVLAMAPYGSELIAHIIAILARTEGPWRGLLVMFQLSMDYGACATTSIPSQEPLVIAPRGRRVPSNIV